MKDYLKFLLFDSVLYFPYGSVILRPLLRAASITASRVVSVLGLVRLLSENRAYPPDTEVSLILNLARP
jgi:hypothetical protein